MTHAQPSARPFTLGCGPMVDALLGLRALQRHYEALPPGDFVDEALGRLDIHADVSGLEHVPSSGPLIVIANHPTGALDGLMLLQALRRVRSDVRVLANEWLTRIPEMREWTIPLNLYACRPERRLSALRRASRWLTAGGALVLFPAGSVARSRQGGRASDAPWSAGVLALARWSRAPIVPVHLDARPSRWLTLARWLPSWATTAMLPRELLRQRGSRVALSIGSAVDVVRLDAMAGEPAQIAYLRARVTALAPRPGAMPGPAVPVAPQVLPSLIARELSALPADACLAESGPLQVFSATAAAIPLTLREIGRLRERTFRAVGEGTGDTADLDRFDAVYQHLFLWHRTRLEIVGAYRLGEARASGPALYTETLFRWQPPPHAVLGSSLELGRSFIRAEYQRHPAVLLLLWKGIGAYVSRRPHLRRLFGPVSVSAAYSDVSRDLIARWLLARLPARSPVSPRHQVPAYPEVTTLLAAGGPATVADLDVLVRELEGGTGLPVLLRQYLRLNGRVLAVSRDPQFADAMDALIVVDLLDMPAAHLERYCGREGARRIRRHWGATETPEAETTGAVPDAAAG